MTTNFFYKGKKISDAILYTTANATIVAKYNVSVPTSLPAGKTTTPYNSVNEKINNMDYKIDGTDISTYMIAPYAENPSGTVTLPAWCNSIRAVIVGGGGGGGAEYHNHAGNSGYDLGSGATTKFYHDYDNDYKGGGAGGSGFIYISNATNITSISAAVGDGGAVGGESAASGDGGNSTLTINVTSIFTAGGGKKGSFGTSSAAGGVGTAGTNTITNNLSASVINYSGTNGSGTTGGVSGAGNNATYTAKSGTTYGNGGGNATAGKSGYIRIYYLIN